MFRMPSSKWNYQNWNWRVSIQGFIIWSLYTPGLGGTLFCGKNSTEFRWTVPPEQLPSARGQFRLGCSSIISGIPGEFRSSSEIFPNFSEIATKTTTNNSLCSGELRNVLSSAGAVTFFLSSAEFLQSPQIPVPPNPGINLAYRLFTLRYNWYLNPKP